ncbi:MAG: hypothetical protein R3246_07935, partial [Acidimicrobiia bacterium]|nr:hypothetical protein [Acidimicrobiia bacterium]
MAHIPHLLVEGPWPAKTVPLDRDTLHHLHTVLRRTPGDVLSYTDGRGRLGQGSLGDGTLMRGDEQEVEPPTSTVVARLIRSVTMASTSRVPSST